MASSAGSVGSVCAVDSTLRKSCVGVALLTSISDIEAMTSLFIVCLISSHSFTTRLMQMMKELQQWVSGVFFLCQSFTESLTILDFGQH